LQFRLEEEPTRGNKNQNNALTALARKGSKYESSRSPDLLSPTIPENVAVPSVTITGSNSNVTTSTTSSASSPSSLHPSSHRRKKPKRRSTGVVNLDVDDLDADGDSAEDDSVPSNPDNTSEKPSNAVTSHGQASTVQPLQASEVRNTTASSRESSAVTNHVGANERETRGGQNGEIDYRKLWEQSQMDNSRLRDDLAKTRDELSAAKKKLETAVQTPAPSGGLTDTEKKEKQALEKKLSEMEEELKQLEHLKNDNQRLRDENGALIRVISKLSK